jgi:chromosome segregation ATPase
MVAATDQPQDELSALREQREALHRELVRKTYRIGELEQEIAEVARTYEESLSWRLTRPVRGLKPLLKRLLGR